MMTAMTNQLRRSNRPFKRALCMLCTACLLAGCAPQAGDSGRQSAPVVPEPSQAADVTVMTNDIFMRDYDDYLREVEAATGLTIEVVASPDNPNDRLAKFHTILSSGDDSVDILSINDEMLSQFRAQDLLAPLEETVVTAEVQEQLYMEYVGDIAMEGQRIYALPQHAEVLAFWVDHRRLEEFGLDTLETREDFLAYMEACREAGIYGYGGAWEKTYVYNEITTFVSLFGGDYLDWENPATREAVQFLYDLVKAGYAPTDHMTQQYDAMMNKFIQEEYGCVFMWNSVSRKLTDSGRNGPEEIAMAPVPAFGDSVVYMASWHYVLNHASAGKESAYQLLRYFASAEGQRADARYFHKFPARKDVLYDPAFEMEGLEELKYYLENYRLLARPMAAETMPFIEGMGDLFQKYILDEINLEEYCRQAQNYVNRYMKPT